MEACLTRCTWPGSKAEHPGNDIVTALINADIDGDRSLPEDECPDSRHDAGRRR